MVELTKTFVRCGHCEKQLAQPMYVCPWCNWPRDHTDETPPPSVGLPDNSFRPGKTVTVQAAPQQGQAVTPSPIDLIEIPFDVPPVPQAPAMDLAALPDLGAVPPEFGITATPIVAEPAPETLMPETDAVTLATQAAERRAALQAQIDAAAEQAALDPPESVESILAGLNYTPKPMTKRKK